MFSRRESIFPREDEGRLPPVADPPLLVHGHQQLSASMATSTDVGDDDDDDDDSAKATAQAPDPHAPGAARPALPHPNPHPPPRVALLSLVSQLAELHVRPVGEEGVVLQSFADGLELF